MGPHGGSYRGVNNAFFNCWGDRLLRWNGGTEGANYRTLLSELKIDRQVVSSTATLQRSIYQRLLAVFNNCTYVESTTSPQSCRLNIILFNKIFQHGEVISLCNRCNISCTISYTCMLVYYL